MERAVAVEAHLGHVARFGWIAVVLPTVRVAPDHVRPQKDQEAAALTAGRAEDQDLTTPETGDKHVGWVDWRLPIRSRGGAIHRGRQGGLGHLGLAFPSSACP